VCCIRFSFEELKKKLGLHICVLVVGRDDGQLPSSLCLIRAR
jgi:hypothetical protein